MDDGAELFYIYGVLRRLKCIRNAELSHKSTSRVPNVTSIFPSKAFLKLVDERIEDMNDLAKVLVADLYKRLKNRPKTKAEVEGNLKRAAERYPELDEYFHISLNYLYDFVVELNWHQAILNDLTRSNATYIKSDLKHVQTLIDFRTTLNGLCAQSKREEMVSEQKTGNYFVRKIQTPKSPGIKSVKSSLSTRVPDSPSSGHKRRVRFVDSPPTNSPTGEQTITEEELCDCHSVIALDLVIFSLNIFIQHLCNHLVDQLASDENPDDSIDFIIEQKQKIRTSKLKAISERIKNHNDIHLAIIRCMSAIRETYLKDYLLGIVCARDTPRQLSLLKGPRLTVFIQRVGLDVERKLILRLAQKCLQLIVDLIVSEINLPPVELSAESKTRSIEDVGKSRENYLNFIASWLNIDEILFGKTNEKNRKRTPSSDTKAGAPGQSTLADGPHLKSSSRILAQMDNLVELIRDLTGHIAESLENPLHLKFFLELAHHVFERFFDKTSRELKKQLESAAASQPRPVNVKDSQDGIGAIARTADVITAKVRCLKLIHIVSSFEKLIETVADQSGVEMSGQWLGIKVQDFTNECTNRDGLAAPAP